ncbi:MAG: hypothetical protein JXB39_04055 [Deltaproteobacteria bacterium]|nr:hypothetical protein [Deltaproteobacteria bacterium]
MNRVPGFDDRVLACEACAAPIEAPLEGGEVACGACGRVNVVAARPQATRLSFGTSTLSEEERLNRLRAQDHKPLLPPESLKSLVEGGGIPDWKMQEATLVWLASRKELVATGSLESAERLSFLTLLFSNRLKGDENLLKRRAMYESALEAFNLPRHQQTMLCDLASQAARHGDVRSAEKWLNLCDPRSDDLHADSYYRYARAIVDTVRGDALDVLEVLGETYDRVPIMDALDGLCTVLRAHAWEQRGDVAKAKEQLEAHMHACGARGQALVNDIAESFTRSGLTVCTRSLPLANEAYSRAAAKQAGGIGAGVGLYLMGLSILMLAAVLAGAVAALLGADLSFLDIEPDEVWITFVVTGLMSLLPFTIGLRMRRSAVRARRLRLHGLCGTGRLIGIETTGLRVNDVPQYRLTLTVRLEDRPPYEARTKVLIPESAVGQFRPGSEWRVRVDPEDPTSVLLEMV